MNQDKIKHIANHYGIKNQLKKTMEKLSELGNETFDYMSAFLSGDEDISTDKLAEQIAKTKIMLKQITYLLECQEKVSECYDSELDRQLAEIRKK